MLGDPVAHSLSPVIMGAALEAAGIPGTYDVRRVDEDGLARAFVDLRAGKIDGANVTMPHKGIAAGLCHDLEPIARRAGAVNTLVRVGVDAIGHNTDVAGIRRSAALAGLPPDASIVILGAGGAAAAALLAFEGREVSISARRSGAGAELANSVGVNAPEVGWGVDVTGAVVVNTTPLGMHGEELPVESLESAVGLLDLPYATTPTPAVALLSGSRAPVVDGKSLLIAQAAESFRLWTGREAEVEAMRRALDGRG